jgi:uncharacterized protein YndB with AHSA1/START domain
MASSTETAVERTIAIDASPETVWQFLVDPEKTTAWWGMTASFDPRPGGAYRIEVIPGHTASGEFVELDAPRRLVYTFGWEAGENGAGPVPPGQPGTTARTTGWKNTSAFVSAKVSASSPSPTAAPTCRRGGPLIKIPRPNATKTSPSAPKIHVPGDA